MSEKVLITKEKLDNLANAVAAKSGEELNLTIDEMANAVLGIDTGEENVLEGVKVNGVELPIDNQKKVNIPAASTSNAGVMTPALMNFLDQEFRYINEDINDVRDSIPDNVSQLTNDSGYITASDIPPIPTVPTDISAFTNDVGYITSYTDEKLKVNSISRDSGNYYPILTDTSLEPSTKIRHSGLKYQISSDNATLYVGIAAGSSSKQGKISLTNLGYFTTLTGSNNGQNNEIVFPNNSGTVALTSDIPTIPTNVSSFVNDAGYMTSYTETDPTVPTWAKQSSKPTYTASEVGALPSTTKIPSKTSDLTNDSGFITSDSDEKLATDNNTSIGNFNLIFGTPGYYGPERKKTDSFLRFSRSSNARGVLQIGENGSAVGELRLFTTTSGGYAAIVPSETAGDKIITLPDTSGTIALTSNIPTVPTNVSSFTNDAGYLTSSDIAAVLTYKGTKSSSASLPTTGNKIGDVWHVTDTGAEYAWDGTVWQELGRSIDVSGFVTGVKVNGTTKSPTSGIVDIGTVLTSHQDISGKADKSTTVSSVDYDSTNQKITKTINGTTSDVVSVSTLKTALGSMPASDVSAWAKASTKPTYTANEVGALPDTTEIPSKTSDLTNDSGYLTLDTLPLWNGEVVMS